jgi:N-acetylmuramoyl-L-alanine amidase CwlA
MLAYEILIKRSVYNGWDNTNSSLEYISHLKKCGYAADDKYVGKVSALIPKAIEVYEQLIKEGDTAMKPTWFRVVKWRDKNWVVAFNGSTCLWKREIEGNRVGTFAHDLAKIESEFGNHSLAFDVAQDLLNVPFENETPIDNPIEDVAHPAYFWALSPNKSSRGGTQIKKIVLHNTAGSFSSAVNWFMNKQSRVSAHAIIQRNPDDSIKFCGQSGKIAIPVPENEKAWHCSTSNADSLGIEIAADANNRGMTDWQEKRVIELVKFWLKKYGLSKKDIFAHRELSSTDCPSLIWPTQADWEKWIDKNF